MPEDGVVRNQLVHRVIATTITCRTIIKYNANLGEAQRTEVLQEIEETLGLLMQLLGREAPRPPEGLVDEEELLAGQNERPVSLRHLYRLYHSYLSATPGQGVKAMETRYQAVMRALDRVQELLDGEQGTTPGDGLRLLGRVRGFVSALYGMFREFALVLSQIIDGLPIDVDTEALELPQPSSPLRDITPVLEVYTGHLRVQERRGALADCIREASAFLAFLEDHLDPALARRKEMVAQIKVVVGLLTDLSDLLSGYEQAVGSIMQSPSASR